jgi:hypothetical protein
MGTTRKTIFPIFFIGIWINIIELIKLEFIFKHYWTEHYSGLELIFPNDPFNYFIWIIWGFLIAAIIFIISERFNLLQTTLLSWLVVFIMLWMVLWNIDILPKGILWINAPLSLFEVFVGAVICNKFIFKKSKKQKTE